VPQSPSPRSMKHDGGDVHVAWDALLREFGTIVERDFGSWINTGDTHYDHNLRFALNRIREGRELVDYFLGKVDSRPIRVLDVGAGNGGVSLALANHRSFHVTAVDRVPNPHLLAVKHAAGIPLRVVIGEARELPVMSEGYDVALCLDMIEHVAGPEKMGGEIMRVLAPGGLCMVTTTARVKYLMGRDPHFQIRGLLALPDSLQELVVRRMRPNVPQYDVEHMFWTVGGIARCFTGARQVEALVNIPYPGTPRTPPQLLRYLLRRILWDRIIIMR
jgi:SAM-dependent methyltransferase